VSTPQLTSPVGTTSVRRADNKNRRRVTNKQNALKYARSGMYGFLSDGKTPLHPRYNKIDTELSAEERQLAVAEHFKKCGQPPLHVGATRDVEVIKSLFRKYPDGVWSLPAGVNKLVVIDADLKDDGPALIRALFEENGGVPTGVVQVPTKSGGVHFYFSDPDGRFSNKAGSLKSQYGCDVRGVGGQIVAPGTLLEDGRAYGDVNHLHYLRMAVARKELPPLPDYIIEKIGAMSVAKQQDIAPTLEREVIQQLEEADWRSHEDDFDAVLGKYDLDALKSDNPEFATLYAHPGTDCSTNRFLAARHLMREWPDMSAPSLSIFFSQWEGAGEYADGKPATGQYDDRQVAREWIKNRGLSKPSNGEAFGPVEDDPDDIAYERQLSIELQEETQTEEKRGMLYLGSELVRQYRSPDWFVQNMLAPRTVGAISGAPNVGKSFGVLDLGQHVSYGRDWFGLKVERSGVLYAYGEGRMGIASRLRAWSLRNDVLGGDIVVRDGIPNFAVDTKAAVKALKRAVKEANAMLSETGTPPIKLLILDTFAKATAGAEENSAKDMGPIMAALRQLADDLNICILIIHHTGKNSNLGLRGSTAILGDLDFSIEILDHETGKKKRPVISIPKGQLCMQVTKMRDGPKGTKFFFKLEPVLVGKDKWAVDEYSMVVHPLIKTTAGSSFDAVCDEEDNAETRDKLSERDERDANIRAESARQKALEQIALGVSAHGVKVSDRYSVKLQSLADKVDSLRDLKASAGASNLVRRFRERMLLGDAEADLSTGRLRLEESRQRGASARLIFTPARVLH
jgi:hypothetical protein